MGTIGERICKSRLDRGLTQGELGEAIGETKQTIYKYERGVVTNIPLSKVEAIAKVLGVSPMFLTGWETKEEKKPPVLELAPEEGRLVRLWRRADEIDQKSVMTILSRYEDIEDPPAPVRMIRHYLVPAAAGYASPIEGEDYEEIPLAEEAPKDADFCITIQGDSMEPYIHDGSLVYVKRGAPLAPFDVGVFFVDGDVFCKQWCSDYAGTLHLLSANPLREDANINIPRDSGRSCVCFGKVLLGKKLPQPVYR
ncbi:MAG: LexA family transcriptional regulator [Oscillospiraceae bacterium]|nr:LexA family transcriptional regulator [Oscillospiraceae bacterium]